MEGARFGPSNPAEPPELPQPLLHVPAPSLCPRHRHGQGVEIIPAAATGNHRETPPTPAPTQPSRPPRPPPTSWEYLCFAILEAPTDGVVLSCPLPRKTCPVSGDSSHAGGRVVEISSGSEPSHPRRKWRRAGWEAGTPGQPPWPEAHLASPRDLVLIAHPICWEEPRPGQDAPSSFPCWGHRRGQCSEPLLS